MERFSDVSMMNLKTDGFENLTFKQKSLAYNLSLAGLFGRDLIFYQNNKYNIDVKITLEYMLSKLSKYSLDPKQESCLDSITNYLKLFWFHQGIYHSQSNKILDHNIVSKEFLSLISFLSLIDGELPENIEKSSSKTISVLFNKGFVPEYKINRESGKDLVADSGTGFYEGLNSSQVKEYRNKNYPKGKNLPMYGLNSFLTLNSKGDIDEDVISTKGLFSKYLKKMCEYLNNSLEFTENENQYKSIENLIKFYETGDPKYFDKHSLDWVKDQDSDLYFINGFIECYDDPLGIACTFESLVAFKNPEQTKKVNNIIKNVQFFENEMPFDDRFKKEKASGLSASSITVCSMSGATSPVLPLGICLPNSEWIREEYGSKSVNLLNVHNSRDSGNTSSVKEFYLEEYHDLIISYASDASSLHTDLHEITGHGSGKMLKGVKNEDLSDCYNVIEECRADLVGLYFLPSKKLIDFGIIDESLDIKDFSKAGYLHYITKGFLTQLNNISIGEDISQTHMRNRYIVTSWLLENSTKKDLEIVLDNGKHYIKLNNVEGCQLLFGKLLSEIQRIKSEGDYSAAKSLIDKYGTIPNLSIHKEVVSRFESLDLSKQVGFYTPKIMSVNENGKVVDYKITSEKSFIEDQMFLSDNYSL